jgi:hypothetical protein
LGRLDVAAKHGESLEINRIFPTESTRAKAACFFLETLLKFHCGNTVTGGYTPVMAWDVEYTDEFGAWRDTLNRLERKSLTAPVGLLADRGPLLGFPFSSVITTSRHAHLRELRTQTGGRLFVRCMRSIRAGRRFC